MRKTTIATLTVLFALLFTAPLFAQIPGLDLSEDVKSYISEALPPYLGTVKISPEAPAADEEVTVTASVAPIKIFDEVDPMDVGEVLLYYTIDGGANWEEVSMDQDGEKYTGTIPGQPSGTTVSFYVKAYSDVGTMNLSISNRQIELKVGQSQAIEVVPAAGGAVSGDDPFANLQLIASDEDDDDSQAPPPADIRELRIGRDDENMYIRLKYDDKIDGGKLTPLLGRIYLGFIINMKVDGDEFDADNVKMSEYIDKVKNMFPLQDAGTMAKEGSKRVFAWFWAPLAEAVPALPNIGKIPKEALLKLNSSNVSVPIFDTAVKAKLGADGTVDIKLPRASLGYADSDSFFLLFGNAEISGNIADYSNLQFKFPDIASPSLVKFTDHTYTIE